MLLATLAKAPLTTEKRDQLCNQLADHMVALANSLWSLDPADSSAPRPRKYWDPTHPEYTGGSR